MSNAWKSFKEWAGFAKSRSQDVTRSSYSLVSTGDLTNDTIQLWLGLPEEVKNDPSWAPFKQLYEKKHDHHENIQLNTKVSETKKRLPFVNSAPLLSQKSDAVEFGPSKTCEAIEETQEDIVTDRVEKGNKQWFAQGKYYCKITVLIAYWIFFTTMFLLYDTKHEISLMSSIMPGELKDYKLNTNIGDVNNLVVDIKLQGPFISEHEQLNSNTSSILYVWLQSTVQNGSDFMEKDHSEMYAIHLRNLSQIDFTEGELRSTKLQLPFNETDRYSIRINSTIDSNTAPFSMSYSMSPLDAATGLVYACVLLFGLYVFIIFEIINRTMAAITVSTMSLAVLSLAGERPSLAEVISWLDQETLLLLFSMMLLVAIMAETGIFDYLAVFTFEVTKGKLWPLIYLLCAITAIFSTFLDNVTTVLLMSPVTIRLCEVMELDPVPILMFMAIFSNIGGAATPVGDPPNVIVASNKAVIESGINFTTFTAHMALGIFLVCIQTSLQIKYIFRDTNKLRLAVPREIQDLTRQISIWRRAADSLPHLSKDVDVVRERLERKIKKLKLQLESIVKESSKRACPKDTFQTTLLDLKEKYKIRDKVLLIKATIAIVFVIVVFFLHTIPELNRVSLGWTALLGAILLLTLADRADIEPILHRVEWSTLLFFGALFVFMEALSKMGLIMYIGGLMEQLILRVDETARLAVAIMLILWVSGVISAFVDNIPLTTMMIRVVVSIGSNPHLKLPMQPLIWSLLFGASLGGNGTLIGASANVVCAGVAEQHGYKFNFTRFFKVGFPVMIGHLTISSVYLLICHCVLEWH